jgi:hypothetical protein
MMVIRSRKSMDDGYKDLFYRKSMADADAR